MGWGRDRDQVRDDPELKPGPVRDGPGAVRTSQRGPGPGEDPGSACAMRTQRDAVHPASRRANPARRNPPALDPREPTWRNAI